jgi:hypothetical protein
MTQLWSTLLAFLFAQSSLARWITRVFSWLQLFEDVLANPGQHLICRSPEGRIKLESLIARCEDWISFLTNARAAELAGFNYTYAENKSRIFWTPHRPRPWPELMQRYHRMRDSFTLIERLAQRRAARLKRAMAGTALDHPLRLDAPHRSTSPALRAVAARHRSLASLRATHWGRWIGAYSRRDGGGAPLHARGPPLIARDCRLPIASEAQLPRSRLHAKNPKTPGLPQLIP